MSNPKFKIPGVFWSALLIAAAALIQANFENAAWYQLAMLVLAGILKGMDVGFNKVIEDITLEVPNVKELDPADISFSRSLSPADEDAPYLTATLEVTEEPSALARWFLG